MYNISHGEKFQALYEVDLFDLILNVNWLVGPS